MLIGSLVMVIVDMPDGCDDTHVYGQIGVISETYRHDDGTYDYTVHNKFGDFVYGRDQIRELTDEECRDALYAMLIN